MTADRATHHLLKVSVLIIGIVSSVEAGEVPIDIDLSNSKTARNAAIAQCVVHLRKLGYPICFEARLITVGSQKTRRKGPKIEAQTIEEALKQICHAFPEYVWMATSRPTTYVITPKSGSVLGFDITAANEKNSTAEKLLVKYLGPHGLPIMHFRQPHSQARGVRAEIAKGKYPAIEFLHQILRNDPDLLWDVGGPAGYRSISISRLSWSTSYRRVTKPQVDAIEAKRRLDAGQIKDQGEVVQFPDPGLTRAIQKALGKPGSPIREAQLAAIHTLDASSTVTVSCFDGKWRRREGRVFQK